MGTGTAASIVHIIDFGLAMQYYDPGIGHHVICTVDNELTRTARYVSINAYRGV